MGFRFKSTIVTATLLATMIAAAPTRAGQVVLSPKGGGFEFEGDLKTFDGTTFVLETASGSMALPVANFECTAGACPGAPAPVAPAVAVTGPAAPVVFTISGSAAMGAELMPALIRGFGARRGEPATEVLGTRANETHFTLGAQSASGAPVAQIQLEWPGTAAGLKALARGEAAVAMAGREMTVEEAAAIPADGVGQTGRVRAGVVGLDAIVILVSPRRQLEALTMEQLAAVFSGRIADWSELRLPAGRIKIFAPDAGTGMLDLFADTVLRPAGAVMSPYATRSSDYADVSDAIARDPDAIGLTSMAYVRNARAIAVVETCGIVMSPTSFTVKTEDYPFSRRLMLYSAASPQPYVRDLLQFAQSSEGQAIVTDQLFVNQGIEDAPWAAEAVRVSQLPTGGKPEALLHQRAVAALSGKRRLSVTFRFASGAVQLDARAREDIGRLAAWLRAPEQNGKSLLFAGFSDGSGTLQPNVVLSAKRAQQVRDAVLAAAGGSVSPDRITASGYGPVAPVSCNTSPQGQNLNRRVEVWLRN